MNSPFESQTINAVYEYLKTVFLHQHISIDGSNINVLVHNKVLLQIRMLPSTSLIRASTSMLLPARSYDVIDFDINDPNCFEMIRKHVAGRFQSWVDYRRKLSPPDASEYLFETAS